MYQSNHIYLSKRDTPTARMWYTKKRAVIVIIIIIVVTLAIGAAHGFKR